MRTVSAGISESFRQAPMGAMQVLTIALCTFMNALDGFDVLAMAFTAPAVSQEWGLPPGELGVLFSISIIGMALGSAFIAPIADHVGRKPLIMVCLLATGGGMLAAAQAGGIADLAVYRLVTGLGIGGLLPNFNALVAEYASNRRRDLCIGMMTMGYSVGAVLGGALAVYLLSTHGWRSVFLAGGVLTIGTSVMIALWLPESVDLLAVRRRPGALTKINRVLERMGLAPLGELPATLATAGGKAQSSLGSLFAPGAVRTTIATFACFFLVMMGYFVLLSWTPKFLVDIGLSTAAGISGSMLMNLAGIVGGMLLGWASGRFGLLKVGTIYFAACFAAVVLFCFGAHTAAFLIPLTAVIGFFMNGAIVTLYATAARVFPPEARATGTGLSLGCGRLGGAIGPLLYGLFVGWGISSPISLTLLVVPMVLGVLALRLALVGGGAMVTEGSRAAVATH